MSLTTTHHDVGIQYGEDRDEWHCTSLDMKAKTLSLLKKKIDKALSVERKIDNLPVIFLGRDGYGQNGATTISRAVATMFDKQPKYGGPQVWVNVIRGNEVDRKKMSVSSIFVDTPENRERLTAIINKNKQINEEQALVRRMLAELEKHCITPLEVAKLTPKEEVDQE